VAIERRKGLRGVGWRSAVLTGAVLGNRECSCVRAGLELLSLGMGSRYIEGYGGESEERDEKDRDEHGNRPAIIGYPKHRMVPFPVRVRSSMGRNPETRENGYSIVTDASPAPVRADEQPA